MTPSKQVCGFNDDAGVKRAEIKCRCRESYWLSTRALKRTVSIPPQPFSAVFSPSYAV